MTRAVRPCSLSCWAAGMFSMRSFTRQMDTLKLRRLAAIVFWQVWVSGLLSSRNDNQHAYRYTRWWFQIFSTFTLGVSWSNLTWAYVFQMGWVQPQTRFVCLYQSFPTSISPPLVCKSSFGRAVARHYDLCCATLVLTNVTWPRQKNPTCSQQKVSLEGFRDLTWSRMFG